MSAEKNGEGYERRYQKRILQAIEKSNGHKGGWWKFNDSFEQLGCGCYEILCRIYLLDKIRNIRNGQKN